MPFEKQARRSKVVMLPSLYNKLGLSCK